ncbi:MAG TPA: GNAT family N-acetyltransferase [Anaerolineales bacterium]|nr:GNAT family N-acetyltransferase [Anaerolineales bacterium]
MANTLKFDNALNIPGLTYRNFQGEEDYAAMRQIFQASMEADGLEAAMTQEDYTNSFSGLSHFEPAKNIFLAEVDGSAIGNGHCYWTKEMDGNYRYAFWINLHPEWRSKGIGSTLLDLLVNRLNEYASQHPDEIEKFFQLYTAKAQTWMIALLEERGFKPIRYSFEMVRPCSQPVDVLPLPEGVEVRPIQPDDVRKVWDADIEAFRDHFGFSEPTEERYQAWQNQSSFNPALWKVAWDGDEIAGQVLNFVDEGENKEYGRKRGYTEDISTRRPWRRQGIARALLSQSIKMFQEMGMDETALGVDAENPSGALKLYEDLGYREHRRWMVYRKYIHKRTN